MKALLLLVAAIVLICLVALQGCAPQPIVVPQQPSNSVNVTVDKDDDPDVVYVHQRGYDYQIPPVVIIHRHGSDCRPDCDLGKPHHGGKKPDPAPKPGNHPKPDHKPASEHRGGHKSGKSR